jgi:hypothetical protein
MQITLVPIIISFLINGNIASGTSKKTYNEQFI